MNQRGFGMVSFLILLPFLISILAVIAGAALVFKADSHLKHECRLSLLSSQRSAAEKLRKLLALNPQAERTRENLAQAKEVLKNAEASGQPEVLALAELNFVIAQTASVALSVRQRALIFSARAISIYAPIKARGAVLTSLADEMRINGLALPSTKSSSRFGRFELIAKPKDDLTPDYQPSARFTAQQTTDVEIRTALKPLLPDWLRLLLPNEGLELKSHCQATITKEGDTWTETLNAVK